MDKQNVKINEAKVLQLTVTVFYTSYMFRPDLMILYRAFFLTWCFREREWKTVFEKDSYSYIHF